MNRMKKFKLNQKGLAWLAKQYEAPSTLSLYRSLRDVESTGGEEILIEQGVLVNPNQMNLSALGLFEKLARVNEVGRLIMVTNIGKFDKTCYKFDDEIITVDQGHENIIVQSPGNIEESIDMFTNLFGFSNLTVSELDIILDDEAALVFSAIIDLMRQQLLGSLASFGHEATSLVQKDQIHQQLSTETNPLRLMSYVKALTSAPEIHAKALDASLLKLEKAGLISSEDELIDLTQEAKSMAENLLVFNGLIRAEVYQEKDGTMNGQKSTVLYSGPNCILLIEKGSDGVHLRALTGIEFIRYLTFIMSDRI